jgi:hypothetical protein
MFVLSFVVDVSEFSFFLAKKLPILLLIVLISVEASFLTGDFFLVSSFGDDLISVLIGDSLALSFGDSCFVFVSTLTVCSSSLLLSSTSFLRLLSLLDEFLIGESSSAEEFELDSDFTTFLVFFS